MEFVQQLLHNYKALFMSGLQNKELSYEEWFSDVRETIEKLQEETALAANKYLITLYWEIGRRIDHAQKHAQWGDKVVEKLAHDLAKAFPNMKGFSRRNIYSIRRWYLFYCEDAAAIDPILTQVPWGHHVLILSKSKNMKEARFYLTKTIENGWSRNVLMAQIESNLYKRLGKSINNFSSTLPANQSQMAVEVLKDPYIFGFLEMDEKLKERDLENKLTERITDFLIELGKGFAYVGRQYKLTVSDKDYFIDLLFYHLDLRCYVVIELKVGEFEPGHAGQLNFYLSAVDSQVRKEVDKPTIGILLCLQKDKIAAEYALRDINKPIGISEFQWNTILPEKWQSNLPTVEEFENEFYK